MTTQIMFGVLLAYAVIQLSDILFAVLIEMLKRPGKSGSPDISIDVCRRECEKSRKLFQQSLTEN
jgi:hypothetical protein